MLQYIIYFIIITLLGILYDKYKTQQSKHENIANHDLIRKYLLNENALSGSKPIIWIHIEHEINSRQWLSFGSRNSSQLNLPYLYITIQSIINNSGNDFNVCLIDDNSFTKLLPGWTIDMDHIADPMRSHLRNLALTKILYYFGGMLVPSSYLALQPLQNVYNKGMDGNDIFIAQTNPTSNVATYVNSFPNHLFMGCTKEHPLMKEIMLYIEHLDSRDYTNEQDFLGQVNRNYFKEIMENKVNTICGRRIGTLDKNNKTIYIDELLGSSYINFDEDLQGIYIPQGQLLKRIKYGWFIRSSPEQIYNSNTILGKYMLLSNEL